MTAIKERTFLPRFLFDANYRIWRHLLFIVVVAIITFNQVFIAYQDSQHVLGSRIYFICFSSFVLYLVAMYFNFFYLAPTFLLKGKYITYSIALCVIVFLLPTLSILGEYYVRNALGLPHRISSYTNPLILVDNLATCMIAVICFCGVSLLMLFRNWIIGNEQVSRLEGEHLQSELNKLKGQIAPAFLSRTLRNASASVETNPGKTTGMLMQLGQLLRYQLYDCNRDKILLKSELTFLTKFLALEQLNNTGIQYHIDTGGDLSKVFVSPMLFIAIVQSTIEDRVSLTLSFNLDHEMLSFICKSDDKSELNADALSLIKKRLELQYPKRHTLMSSPGMIALKIAVSG